MKALTFTLRPHTAFATPLWGDTLFGQLCWSIRHGWGETRLAELLDGYTTGKPFLVVSDAFPAGYLPLPALPTRFWSDQPENAKDRKALKKKVWVPHEALTQPLKNWRQVAVEDRATGVAPFSRPQPRNSLNRLTFTTGEGEGFSPYSVGQTWYRGSLEVHLRLDEDRISCVDVREALAAVGASGFGKDASVGLGKFDVEEMKAFEPQPHDEPNVWFTLAPCAPQRLAWDARRSFYRPFTRYGRHGDIAVRLGNPFKTPILLTASGAILAPRKEDDWSRGWVGQGLGGDGTLSRVLPSTVHQGYAPAIAVHLPEAV